MKWIPAAIAVIVLIVVVGVIITVCSPYGPLGTGTYAPPKSVASTARVAGDWPTYHGGYSLDGVARGTVPDAPERLWRYKAGNRVEVTPVSAEGRIYFTSAKGGLHAVDLSGQEVWKKDVGKENAFSSPVLCSDGLVVAVSQNGSLMAFDGATGKERWKYDLAGSGQGTPNRIDLPGGKGGVVAISQGDGCIHAVDLETGKGLWKTDAVERCDGSAGVGNGLIVMGSCASALHLYSVEKAAKVADVPLGGDCQVAGGVAISGRMAYAGSRGGKFFAVDTAEKKIAWTNADCQREAFTTPAVTDRWVVFGSDDGKLYGLDRATGKKAWEFDTGNTPKSPVVAGERVAVTSGGVLFLLDLATGKKVWSENVSDEITSPAIVGGMVLVGSDDGTVSAYGRK
jgi:outer membrane protein assembly factor BamB